MSDRTASSVLTNLAGPLAVFAEAICAKATSGDDFDLREVRRQRMSIYLGIAPGNLPKYDRLINLFFSQLIAVNTTTLPEQDPTLKVQCLLMLDEFAAMGRVHIIAKAISYTAGYNLRFFLIFQSEAQLKNQKLYGPEGAKDLLDNCAVKLVFPPKEVGDDARSYSETLGYTTVKAHSRGRSMGKHNSRSDNVSEQKRALMMPQEIVDLGKTLHRSGALASKQIILMEKVRPFIADKIVSFDEPLFQERLEIAKAKPVTVPVLDF
jgi:type IV secretion system protein VirD4